MSFDEDTGLAHLRPEALGSTDASNVVSLSTVTQALLQALPDPVFVVDRQGRYLYVGQAAMRLLDKPASAFMGTTVQDIEFPPEVAATLAAQTEQVFRTGQSAVSTDMIPTVDGPRWYDHHASPITDDQGAVVAMLWIAQDVTERVLLEAERVRRQDVQAARRETEDALREQQERYRLMVENAQEGIWLIGPDATTEYVNPYLTQMLGYSAEEMVGRNAFDFVFPEDLSTYQQIYNNRKAGVSEQLEVRWRRQDGSELWTLVGSDTLLDDQGRFIGALALMTDLTQRRQHEAEIAALNRDLQRRLHEIETIFQTVPVALIIAEDIACLGMRGNPATYEMLRLPEGANVSKTGPPEEIPPFRVYRDGQEIPGEHLPMQVAARTGQEVRNAELDIVWDDGETHHWYGSASPLLDEQGQPRGSVGAFVDITRRKQTEAQLRQSEERLRFALDAAHMVAWDWDVVTGQVSRQGDLMGVFGIPPAHATHTLDDLLRLLHPDDREEFEASIQSALDGDSDLQMKYRIVRPDGAVRWIADVGRVQRDAEGTVVRFSGVLRDVTAHKVAADALRQSEEQSRQQARLLDTLLDNVPTGITIAEPPDVRIRRVSRYRELISGVGPEEVEGKRQAEVLWNVVHPEGVALATEAELPLTRATLHGEVIRSEEWVLVHPRTGEKMVLLCNASPVRDEAGTIVMGILAWSDITTLKAAHEEIARLNQRLHRSVYEASHRIKNQLQVLTATADMVLMDGLEMVAADALRRLRSQIGAIATTHDLLTKETRADGTADHISLKALLYRTLASLQQTTDRHRLRYTFDDLRVPLKAATSLALIVNEAVCNAIKHGGKMIDITLVTVEGAGQLEVCDDGPGFPAGFDAPRAANTGLELMMTLTRIDLDGTVTFGNRAQGGARVTVTFPLLDIP